VPFVRVIKPETLSLLTRPFEFRREFWLGVAVLAFVPIGDTPVLLPEAAMWPFLSEELPPDLPLDAAIPKVRAEFLAVAHCQAPDAVAAPLVRTGIQLGPLIKLLDVHGDRMLDQRTRGISKAVPFEHMPIDWSHAYGGPGFADNPLGKSLLATDAPTGTVPVHNILNPRLGRDGARMPVSYGPVDQAWPSRARFAGTYDDAWLKQDFPGFARDIDWRFFNAASADQWLSEPLKGDETCAFKNLHPEQKLLKGRLPGMAPRLFLVRKSDAGSFEEVPLSLTTVWFFPHRERMALVHHGRARIAQEDASDIARVVIGADLLNALRPADEFRAVMVKRADTKGRAAHALRDADLVPVQLLPPAATGPVAEPEGPGRAVARARKRAEREYAAARETIRREDWIRTSTARRNCRPKSRHRRWTSCRPLPKRPSPRSRRNRRRLWLTAKHARRKRPPKWPRPGCRRTRSRSGSIPSCKVLLHSTPPPCAPRWPHRSLQCGYSAR
jgi:hypothetical protein